jgi:hypothetical protein
LPALSHWTLRVAFDIGHGGYCRLAFDDPATFINHQIADSNLDKGAGGADRRRRTDLSFRLRGIAHDLGAELAFIKGTPGQIVRLELPQISNSNRMPCVQAAE